MMREEAIQVLRRALEQVTPHSPDPLLRVGAQIANARHQVIARYAPMFAPENLDRMTAEDFRGFLLFKNNQHWDSLHRMGGFMTADMPKLREAIRLLVDEGLPLRTRLNRLRPSSGNPMVKGLGRAVITAILLVCYPQKYGVLNNTAEGAMKKLGLLPTLSRGASFGERYDAVNRVLLETAASLEADLWTLDMLWWRVGDTHMPRGAGVPGECVPQVPSDEEIPVLYALEDDSSAVFGLERYLQEFLVDNWQNTELGRDWELLEEDGEIVGTYYNTGEVGEIDLLAKHRHENSWLVVELKKAQTSDSTVGQVLRYMAWVRRNLASDGGRVEGAIICGDVDRRLQYALDGQPNIRCFTYTVNFSLNLAPELSQ